MRKWRKLYASILGSESLTRVSSDAFALCTLLIAVQDDSGYYPWTPTKIRQLIAVRPDWTLEDADRYLEELIKQEVLTLEDGGVVLTRGKELNGKLRPDVEDDLYPRLSNGNTTDTSRQHDVNTTDTSRQHDVNTTDTSRQHDVTGKGRGEKRGGRGREEQRRAEKIKSRLRVEQSESRVRKKPTHTSTLSQNSFKSSGSSPLEPTEITEAFRAQAATEFPDLGGRPEIDIIIDHALGHKSAANNPDKQAYVRDWLRRERPKDSPGNGKEDQVEPWGHVKKDNPKMYLKL